MKKLLLLGLAVFAFVACGKDEEKGGGNDDMYNLVVEEGTSRPAEGMIKAGTTVTLTADEPGNTGWEVLEGPSTLTISNGRFQMPSQDVRVRPLYEGNTVTVEGGTAMPDGMIAEGTVVTLSPSVIDGKVFMGWESEEVTVGADYTFVMPGNNVSVTAMHEDEITPSADFAEPNLLYFDGQRLALGKLEADGGAVTMGNVVGAKFGSLIGFLMKANSDDWDVSDIAFNPTDKPASAYANYSDITYMSSPEKDNATWVELPGFPVYTTDTGNEYNRGIDGYSTANHTTANVAAGLGDICKLIGLTSVEAAYLATQGSLASYDSGYRLPTMQEWTEEYPAGTVYPLEDGGSVYNMRNEDKGFLLPIFGQRNDSGRVVGARKGDGNGAFMSSRVAPKGTSPVNDNYNNFTFDQGFEMKYDEDGNPIGYEYFMETRPMNQIPFSDGTFVDGFSAALSKVGSVVRCVAND